MSGSVSQSAVMPNAIVPARLDTKTTALIRQELFDAWLVDTLKGVPLTLPLLDLL